MRLADSRRRRPTTPMSPPRGIGDVDAARLCSAFEAGADIDAITKDIVAFDQHVAKVDTNSELHPPIVRDINVPFRHELLDRHGALDRGDDGGKLNEEALIAAGMTTRATAATGNDRFRDDPRPTRAIQISPRRRADQGQRRGRGLTFLSTGRLHGARSLALRTSS